MKEFSKSGGFQVGGASMHPGHLPTCPMDGVTWSQQKGETPKEGTTGTRCSTCWRVPPGESMVQRIDSLNFCVQKFVFILFFNLKRYNCKQNGAKGHVHFLVEHGGTSC